MISQIIGCAECTETTCLMCHNLSPDCLRSWQLPAADCSPSCTHFPPQIGQAFVHHLIFNQIRSRLSCHAVRGVNGGSYALPSANEKLQSTHGCHFLSCLPQQIRGTEKVWLTRPVHFQHRPIQLGPEPIVAQLFCIWVSVQKQSFPTAPSLKLAQETNCLSIKLI